MVDFKELAEDFSDEQRAEFFTLMASQKGLEAEIRNADVAHSQYQDLRRLASQVLIDHPKLGNRINFQTNTSHVSRPTSHVFSGPIIALFKNADTAKRLQAGVDADRFFAFRYQDEQGNATQKAGTLGVAVNAASALLRKTGEALVRNLPEGVRQNPESGHLYVTASAAEGLAALYNNFVVVFARSA